MSADRLKFERLIADHMEDLQRYALWLCKNPTLANDLVQETFLRAWKAHGKLRDQKAAKSWLITIWRTHGARW